MKSLRGMRSSITQIMEASISANNVQPKVFVKIFLQMNVNMKMILQDFLAVIKNECLKHKVKCFRDQLELLVHHTLATMKMIKVELRFKK